MMIWWIVSPYVLLPGCGSEVAPLPGFRLITGKQSAKADFVLLLSRIYSPEAEALNLHLRGSATPRLRVRLSEFLRAP
jgi:hypothetical protein